MTYFAIGDFHGKSIEEFIREEQPDEDDIILSTGDFDQTDIIHEVIDLQDRVGEVIEVGGNHDYAMLNRQQISSGEINSQFKSYQEMVDELHNDSEALKHIKEVLSQPVKEFQLGEMNAALVHGGLTGYLQNPDISEEIRPFWYRLWNEEDFENTFKLMDQEEYDLLIRGHDHWTEHAFSPKTSDSINYHLPEPTQSYQLDDDYQHIITHGPWFEEKYLKISDDGSKLTFKQL